MKTLEPKNFTEALTFSKEHNFPMLAEDGAVLLAVEEIHRMTVQEAYDTATVRLNFPHPPVSWTVLADTDTLWPQSFFSSI
jgi:hypothetical protein